MSSTAGNMDGPMKDNGLIVDMSPAAMMNHNALAAHTLCSMKEASQDNISADVSRRCSISPTNLTTQPAPVTTFRCERCDNFETNSRASLLLHVVQCLSNAGRLKIEEQDGENVNNAAGTQVESIVAKLPIPEAQPPKSVTPTSVVIAPAKGSANSTPATSSSTAASPSSGRKVFECDVCNMKFSNGANMRRHKMRHTGVKPYECRVCQKRFFRKDHLAEHFTTHTKTLPYHCPICNRGFQRQIAMRAHFQNEHVGQHDLVKTCPLCSYRAGSMKSLRIHFFNRHGIDLDNPGPGGTSSLLLALETQASQVAAAAAAAGFVANLNVVAAATASNNINPTPNAAVTSHHSDSGESMRSMDNATPPMHFLTPHVEISTVTENAAENFNGNNGVSEAMDTKMKERDFVIHSPVPPVQDQPLDCNTKSIPSSTSNLNVQISVSPKSNHHDNHITPSISLIPIKQEPQGEDLTSDAKNSKISKLNEQTNGSDNSETDYSSTNNRMTSLIKVSPLKSLLREDLKRRICAKANNRMTRNAAALENNNVLHSPITVNNATNNSTPICNGTITSTGQEPDAMTMNRKQILTCLFCGIEFPDETLYFLHKGCHCDSNPWKCNICGEQCNNVYEFNSHLLSKSHQ